VDVSREAHADQSRPECHRLRPVAVGQAALAASWRMTRFTSSPGGTSRSLLELLSSDGLGTIQVSGEGAMAAERQFRSSCLSCIRISASAPNEAHNT
jgi:hypothetical protein